MSKGLFNGRTDKITMYSVKPEYIQSEIELSIFGQLGNFPDSSSTAFFLISFLDFCFEKKVVTDLYKAESVWFEMDFKFGLFPSKRVLGIDETFTRKLRVYF